MPQGWGYRIFSLIVLCLFGGTWWAAYTGMGLSSTAATEAQQQAIIQRRSARVGAVFYGGRYYGGSGPRFGK
jgi:hypothetical protein